MRIGIVQVYDGTAGRGMDYVRSCAAAAERRGFDTFWVPDHVALFDAFDSRYPYSESGTFPWKPDQGMYEPLLALAAAASSTQRIRLGVSVEIVPLRQPLLRAQQITALDHLCGGRFNYGVGVGWAAEEYDAVGVPFARRGAVADDYLAAVKELWTARRAGHDGEFFRFSRVIQFPKPLQRPHPPVYVGGNSPAAVARAVRLGDGWYGWGLADEDVAAAVTFARSRARDAGRDAAEFQVLLGQAVSSVDEAAAFVQACARAEVDEVVVSFPFSHSRFETQLEQLAGALGVRPPDDTDPRTGPEAQ